MTKNIHITSETLSIDACRELIVAPKNGGECIFVGTVRNMTKGEEVTKLVFEAYEPMALKEMTKIADAALEKFAVSSVVIHHRTGELGIGEIPVIIAVGAPHRDAAFEACRFAIDTLKETVPIWKKEFLESGEVWVSAHP